MASVGTSRAARQYLVQPVKTLHSAKSAEHWPPELSGDSGQDDPAPVF